MEIKNITAKQANEAWLKAIKAKFERESKTLFSRQLDCFNRATISEENARRQEPVKVETRRRANGRTFSVAIYADGTTSDLD